MRRSEAINIMSDILHEASGHLAEEINPRWLLSRIEESLGMLPPAIYSEMFGFDPEYKWDEEWHQ